ncbi:nucleic acid-binding protein, containing PIN domain [Methanospirillum hungatei JF-1]|uniref:Nucleic acid-binding protein, containing PIN domain n=1 Tax=Methanospirillum hungatei JF-1 (strain ATCC 27890 / DSM 864 / NBRC 100397 / JF-1) TaxID=323259 RepID=Q2FTD9_METHJ|nr:PIN domain-containing protein [Methanospirillum hungatei]ABD42407.1 nucleic acid-binding protein, containing PIN domain [Methanospirillum hungatei JF-1]
MDIFIDTSVIIPFLIESPATMEVRGFFENFHGSFHTCSMVYQETLFIGMRLIAVERLKIRSYIDLKEYIIKNGHSFADDFYEKVSLLFGNMTIHRDSADTDHIMQLMVDYGLFPADAVIAATSIEQKITLFASRDKDYSRICYLKLFPFNENFR